MRCDQAHSAFPPTSGTIIRPITREEATAVLYKVNLDPGALYRPSPGLKAVIQCVTINLNQTLFSAHELYTYLSSYILLHKSRLFDDRNIAVVICDYLLTVALNVSHFHRIQVSELLTKQVTAVVRPTNSGLVVLVGPGGV